MLAEARCHRLFLISRRHERVITARRRTASDFRHVMSALVHIGISAVHERYGEQSDAVSYRSAKLRIAIYADVHIGSRAVTPGWLPNICAHHLITLPAICFSPSFNGRPLISARMTSRGNWEIRNNRIVSISGERDFSSFSKKVPRSSARAVDRT